ncbi:MAG: D-alanyl-D-alanine carboxypeptidase [Saprospiraceae bacterium]
MIKNIIWNSFQLILVCSFLIVMFQSCSVKYTSHDYLDKDNKFSSIIEADTILSNHFAGVSVYSITDGKSIIDYNSTKLFTAASNTKILTFYAALKLLNDSLVTFYHYNIDDTLFVKPNGAPSFLHPDFNNTAINKMVSWKGEIVILNDENLNNYYGSGWAWDDYADYYQSEINNMPMYGNCLWIKKSVKGLTISPQYFQDSIIYLEDNLYQFSREGRKNKFYVMSKKREMKTNQIPFVTGESVLSQLLSDTLHKDIEVKTIRNQNEIFAPYNGIAKDTVLKKMMFDSDNFIAEQIMVMIANQLKIERWKEVQKAVIDSVFHFSNEKIRWHDGSGLSRYNLLTPKFLTDLLSELHSLIGKKEIVKYFPAGGKDVGLTNYRSDKNGAPYFFAKTGTLRNNHNLSGYLITDKGKWVAFSIMNNNYYGSSATVKPAIQKLLMFIKEKY